MAFWVDATAPENWESNGAAGAGRFGNTLLLWTGATWEVDYFNTPSTLFLAGEFAGSRVNRIRLTGERIGPIFARVYKTDSTFIEVLTAVDPDSSTLATTQALDYSSVDAASDSDAYSGFMLGLFEQVLTYNNVIITKIELEITPPANSFWTAFNQTREIVE
jgi:hypothetical protein